MSAAETAPRIAVEGPDEDGYYWLLIDGTGHVISQRAHEALAGALPAAPRPAACKCRHPLCPECRARVVAAEVATAARVSSLAAGSEADGPVVL